MLNAKELAENLKNTGIKKFIYPAVVLAFFVTVIIIFILSAKFISLNLGKTFYEPAEKDIQSQKTKLDLREFMTVIKKIGEEKQPEVIPPPIQTPNETVETIDKKTLRIAIFNAAQKSGVAAKLKTDLETTGFAVEKTDNWPEISEKTIIKIREDKKKYTETVDEIEKIVSEKYILIETQTLENSSEFDVEIIIGKK